MTTSTDVHQRLRELRATVVSGTRELESLAGNRNLAAEIRLQLNEATSHFADGAYMLEPLPGHRVRRAA